MERVSALVRANLNDLIDKAEDPEKMLKQVILDMENQLIQVKTQVAIAIADEHLLTKKQKDNEAKIAEWMRKAELAVDKKDDALARAALERADSCRQIGAALDEQLADQKTQVEALRNAYRKLEDKLGEARAKCDLLIAQHRRSRAVRKAAEASMAIQSDRNSATFDRMRRKVHSAEAVSVATAELAAEDVEQKFDLLERDDRINRLLEDLKAKRRA
ncbi:MAG TPA: PspA/IM30 family protein, partial [Thermoanaerobaculia bacterium]|nr:PspA/IM30 family protein [Thermoanaerobaculia bacterium]